MKYSEIIGVEPYFDSTFNIVEEKENYWKQFITNEKFESNLSEIVNAFISPEANYRKSIWIQGTYGTGKSHSTSVIKHLLSDDVDDVSEYIDRIGNIKLRTQLKTFRTTKRVFPVVLKGTNEIVDVEEMKYVIQRAVQKQLEDRGIEISVKSDFDAIISMIDDVRFSSFWENELRGELKKYASDIDDIRNALNDGDVELLKIINTTLKKSGIMKATDNIVSWLTEVKLEIESKGIADYLVIFWDEFTSLLDIAERRSILDTIQNIAELSKAPHPNRDKGDYDFLGVYVFLVTHKTLESTDSYRELKEDEKTMAKARFLELKYDMQDITTYHILSNAIKINDNDKHQELIDEREGGNISISDTLNRITESSDKPAEIKATIKTLYPFHPYTAYLATFVSRAIGSAERSIFEFLNDSNKGFKRYIENDINNSKFLTADYVWDFFVDAFMEDNTSNFDAITSKYTMHIENMMKKGACYAATFKVILLLNLLNRVTSTDVDYSETSLVNPSEDNITSVLSGEYSSEEINEVLRYLDESQIIIRNPEGVFEVAASAMPLNRVQSTKETMYSAYEDLTKIFEEYPITFRNLSKEVSNNISRESEVKEFWAGAQSISISSKLAKAFDNPYAVHVALFYFRGRTSELERYLHKIEADSTKQKEIIQKLSEEPANKNVIFVVIDEKFGNNGFEGFIDSKARESVARDIRLIEDAQNYRKKSGMWIDDWEKRIRTSGTCSVIFRGQKVNQSFAGIGKYILREILPTVFKYGIDQNINICNAGTAWTNSLAKKTVENICFTEKRSDYEDTLQGASKAILYLLKDNDGNYIFDDDFNYIGTYDLTNPMEKLIKTVEDKIVTLRSKTTVDLGEEFKFLNEPEFGYYTNSICMAAVTLAFRKYIDTIYLADQGSLVNNIKMKDIIVAMFTYWKEGKHNSILRVRFSTQSEQELIDLLHDVFNVDGDGIVETKWNLRNKFELDCKAPLWTLKLNSNDSNFNSLIDNLFSMVIKPNDGIKEDIIENLLTGLKLNKTTLILALKSIRNQNVLNEYVRKQLESVGRNAEEVESVMDYLNHEMQENIVYWEENTLKMKVLEWCARREPSDDSEMVIEYVSNDNDDEESIIEEWNDDEDVVEFEPLDLTPMSMSGKTRSTIDNATALITDTVFDAKSMKELLISLCNEYPVICDKIIDLLKG